MHQIESCQYIECSKRAASISSYAELDWDFSKIPDVAQHRDSNYANALRVERGISL